MGQSTEGQLTDQIADTREDLSRNLDALTDKVSPSRVVERRKEAVRGRFGRVRDRFMGTAHDVRGVAGHATSNAGGSVSDRASQVGSTASDAASGAVDTVSSTAHGAAHTVQERTEGNPLAVGLIAFGAGALIGSLLPATQKETRVARQVVETAKEKGQPLVEEAKSVGQDVSQDLREHATEAAQEVRSTAEEGVRQVRDEGQSSAQNVKDDARSRTR
ncbi:Protein of unknown function [Actinopolymorpha cephalotaxi]|uniref:Gas vesicle protein n=1 Tax=Actinopolymorpha cephalotaxi TaxID=504797 RepID=A0A1I2M7Y3_9ACTN|nr:DUF3618 domain-containing protein [Actinopolymorpha cephalotaxi]NYH81539.1 gas vesicle protein [Actinopolymorpha cephalotaxi]SFF85301.1 Protein of unknown function [Actinopolymorpha cephalotaxi]